ncbi:acetoacetate--CoA ligase [Marinospirillum insulare]|uniref:Acetoacetyl-CoA synthetase n=1 Tax=Marinospirillum insulare TaxID=217169 RepID=A0ABQ6A5B0_9GAMM|nr:acetoacetate--CoA ligase [Marinospirillum insulare]GLR65285.1 acetoacetyl-CoA synthetase [Marinospirillum insulare]
MPVNQPLWQPSPSSIAASPLAAFMQQVNEGYQLQLTSYEDLFQWSNTHSAEFWSEIWDFGGVVAAEQGSQALVDAHKMSGARWFPEARLNFAQNLLKFRDDRPAIISLHENGQRISLTHAQLYDQVAQISAALQKAGVKPGDRVAGFVPNCHYALIAMLAATSLGAIWSSCSPDFGFNGVLDRFGQIQPKFLFATDGYLYNGKRINSLPLVAEIVESLDALQEVVVFPYLETHPDISGINKSILWDDFRIADAKEIDFAQLPFDHPIYIMYSSGTTGEPKCIVHSAGGTLLQHLKEHLLHTSLTREDTLFYYTTCGWMMWNWLVSGLAAGAALVLFDGSPFAPEPKALWDMAENEEVSVFGTSAKYIAACEKAGLKPGTTHKLPKLRAILSTGSPLSHESFDYVYREIKQDLLLASISGGTDIVSCFALGCPIRPVYRGQLQARGLGMDVQVFNDAGQPVLEEKGELVCTQPFPSMPIGFWNDEDGSKYQAAYFDRFDNIWAHGDYAEITAEDGMIIHGRSDAVLNPGGVRIGTAEIYRQVEKVEEVLEALCIGQDWKDDVRVVLFVRMKEGFVLDDAMRKRLRDTIRSETTPRHVPSKIIQVADIPRTLSGKIVELAVREVVHGRPVKNQDALANPEALELFVDLPELQS